MKGWSQLWFLVPHAVSAACFAAAFEWMSIVGTNRSEPDFNFAMGGFVALVVALVSSSTGIVIGLHRQGARRYWPWLLVHPGALVPPLVLAHYWLAAHIA